MGNNFYARLKRGETIKCVNPDTRQWFDLEPVYQFNMVFGYRIRYANGLEKGEIAPGYEIGKELDETFDQITCDVTERPSDYERGRIDGRWTPEQIAENGSSIDELRAYLEAYYAELLAKVDENGAENQRPYLEGCLAGARESLGG